MNSSARDQILVTLNSALKVKSPPVLDPGTFQVKSWPLEERIDLLKTNLEAVRSEVHLVDKSVWVDAVKMELKKRKLASLLYSPNTYLSADLENGFESEEEGAPRLSDFEVGIGNYKDQLFGIDAAVTTTWGAIADNGSIIIWPTKDEPRMMSLVPPVHIAILKQSTIFNTFSEVVEKQSLADKMPTNLILTSGPSKTADIELVLAFGVHGPKELLVFIVNE